MSFCQNVRPKSEFSMRIWFVRLMRCWSGVADNREGSFGAPDVRITPLAAPFGKLRAGLIWPSAQTILLSYQPPGSALFGAQLLAAIAQRSTHRTSFLLALRQKIRVKRKRSIRLNGGFRSPTGYYPDDPLFDKTKPIHLKSK